MTFILPVLLQIVDTTTTAIDLPTTGKLTFFELLLKGGFVMIPLIILSILAFAIIIEKTLSINASAKIEANFFNNIKGNESVHTSVFRFCPGNSIQKRSRHHNLQLFPGNLQPQGPVLEPYYRHGERQ